MNSVKARGKDGDEMGVLSGWRKLIFENLHSMMK